MVIRVNIKEGNRHSELWHKYVGRANLSEDQEVAIIDNLRLGWKNRHQLFLETQFWQRIRKEVLKRDNFSCVLCGSTVNVHVDHINYPGHGQETLDDLQTLCYFCHAAKTTKIDMRAKRPIKRKLVKLQDNTELFTLLRGRQ